MPILAWLKGLRRNDPQRRRHEPQTLRGHNSVKLREEDGYTFPERETDDSDRDDTTKFVYLTCSSLNDQLIAALQSETKSLEIFATEKECFEFLEPVTDKVFLIIDGKPSNDIIIAIQPLNQIDSVFFHAGSPDETNNTTSQSHNYLVHISETEEELIRNIKRSLDEMEKQTAAFSMYNKKEKATRDLSKERGSFLFFQLFKILMKSMPKTAEAKTEMVNMWRDYYRGNAYELKNIDEFDHNYKSAEAIQWYTKEAFLYRFINKALRTEDVDVMYQFRSYIMDLSEQLNKEFQKLKAKYSEPLKLYRGLRLSQDEIDNLQKSIGNLISTNGYLSTSSEYVVAHFFATNSPKREGTVRVLFEYEVDMQAVKSIVLADIREYSRYPEEAEVLVDIGASFQIDKCYYSEDDDLWRVHVHATDQGAALAAEYMEYQKKKMAESNIVLMFGNLLLEMGEYAKAEKYLDRILNSSNPNDEEIACIYFNFGRTHRLKGDFNRAINCYNRAYNLHMNARPKRLASAGKTLNGLGVVYCELEKFDKAEDCFRRTLKLYKTNLPKKHKEVANTLINLGTIHCGRGEYELAVDEFVKAMDIFRCCLPPGHPNHALPRVNLGNIYLAIEEYEDAGKEYEAALQLQKRSLPGDHPDIARTLHNLAIVYTHLGNVERAKEYLELAEETAGQTLVEEHPVMARLYRARYAMNEEGDGAMRRERSENGAGN